MNKLLHNYDFLQNIVIHSFKYLVLVSVNGRSPSLVTIRKYFQVAPREATQLYTAIDRRIATLKSQKSTIKSTSDDLTASGEQETICANLEDENKEIKNKFITGDVTLTNNQEETNKEHTYNAEKLPETLPDKPI